MSAEAVPGGIDRSLSLGKIEVVVRVFSENTHPGPSLDGSFTLLLIKPSGKQGHDISVLLDGDQDGTVSSNSTFTLTNLEARPWCSRFSFGGVVVVSGPMLIV